MAFSRYLYGKIKGANTKFVYLILNDEELEFLNMFNIQLRKIENENNVNTYLVDSQEVKNLFCN